MCRVWDRNLWQLSSLWSLGEQRGKHVSALFKATYSLLWRARFWERYIACPPPPASSFPGLSAVCGFCAPQADDKTGRLGEARSQVTRCLSCDTRWQIVKGWGRAEKLRKTSSSETCGVHTTCSVTTKRKDWSGADLRENPWASMASIPGRHVEVKGWVFQWLLFPNIYMPVDYPTRKLQRLGSHSRQWTNQKQLPPLILKLNICVI